MDGFQAGRRKLLGAAVGMTALTAAGASRAAPASGADWDAIAQSYDIAGDFVNLENAYYGIMARPVAEDFKRNIDYLNRYNSYHLRRQFDRAGMDQLRTLLAAHTGVAPEELAITRGATESLQNLICNYKLLKRGDSIMYANLDYDAMQYAMNDLAQRSGAKVAVVQLPDQLNRQAAVDTYDKALRANPRTRLLLLTHINHRTGFVLPVVEIIKLAKARGVDVILDVAQSWGQLDYKLPDLGADFIGANLHKWVGAPLGTGFLYIRKERLADIGIERGDEDYAVTDIRSRVHSGTVNAAALMTIPAALKLHDDIGVANRGRRLRALRDHWVSQLRGHDGVQILTPDEEGSYGAVTSFRLKGHTSFEQNVALVNRLVEQYRIFTVARKGPAGGACIRVTPGLFTRTADLDQLVAAIRNLA
ncbi:MULTISPECIES: aminotransferase class V-fold PLP-dependent enzyme [unclassified Duganella]|uniref:aminotransferase class V-fold PLP-dependent enzyme n=1 Tax=unclassified Duganella TaxID=2636909 RepID=UPI00087F12F7|nr:MULTISPECIES: aminotransferase class V-fold PLP-dependent enzyme [unclassified Duganella]SDF95380.1 Selenocysteine lyase/Cysteine desulfurase [Duganella sp. OV458]SDJ09331.1 Selenocysteine lyase/Cysteine desulfurase [Duganella sp. OV510]